MPRERSKQKGFWVSMKTKPSARKLIAALVLAATLGRIETLEAHTIGISRGEYRITGGAISAELVFARPELLGAIPALDTDRDGDLSQSEVSTGRTAVENLLVHELEVRSPSGSCAGKLREALLTEEDGVAIRSRYDCPNAPAAAEFKLNFLGALSHGHRHLAAARTGSTTASAVAYADSPAFRVEPSSVQADSGVALPLFFLGIQHILSGYDHLVFLLGLIIIGGRMRALLAAITAFTVAHSITLGIATLDIWAPSSRFAESAIALSIAYIGVENWFVKNPSRRWLITFPFGLVHGFGFAGALHEIALPENDIPQALFSFNAGVEAGQVAVLLVVLPTILWLRRRPWFAGHAVKAISAAIALAGVVWFVGRVV
jgi:hydrogenase/urease accessory protein HupE